MQRGAATLRFSFPSHLQDWFRAFDPPPSCPEGELVYGSGEDPQEILSDLAERIPKILTGHLCLHAAALSRRGRGLLLPAPAKGGKSTLAAALVHEGWTYYSDDLAIIRIRDGKLLSFPRPIDLRPGAIDLLPRPTRDMRAHGHALRISRRRTGRGPVPVRWIIFPHVRLGRGTRISALEGGDAVVRTSRMGCNLHRLGKEGFDAVVALVRGARCHALEVGRLRDGIRTIAKQAADVAGGPSII